jgi:hypothetical protein
MLSVIYNLTVKCLLANMHPDYDENRQINPEFHGNKLRES